MAKRTVCQCFMPVNAGCYLVCYIYGYSWTLYVIMWLTWMMIVTLALRGSRIEMGCCAASELNKSPVQNTDECWYK